MMLSKAQRQLKRQIFNSLFSIQKTLRTLIRRRTTMPQLITATVTAQEFKDLFEFDEPSGLYNDPKFRLVLKMPSGIFMQDTFDQCLNGVPSNLSNKLESCKHSHARELRTLQSSR